MKLNFPEFELQIKSQNGKKLIFDRIRNKYVLLTPEEWVRQHLIHDLIGKGYPAGRMSIERRLPGSDKRYDLVVFDAKMNPLLLAECKAPDVNITQSTLNQTTGYISLLDVPHIVLTNGYVHLHIARSLDGLQIVQEIPLFSQISE